MKRKPEWMIMYQELVNAHTTPMSRRFEHIVCLPSECIEEDHVEWCLGHLGMHAWSWTWDGDLAVFSFIDQEDAMLFRMVWE